MKRTNDYRPGVSYEIRSFRLVIALLLLTVLCGCPNGDSDGADEDTDPGDGIEISWINEGTLLVFDAEYTGGGLSGFTGHTYFEAIGASGDIQITAALEDNTGNPMGDITDSFAVQEGAAYRLSVDINCAGPSNYDPGNPPPGYPNELTVTYTSPSAGTVDTKTLEGGFYTASLSLGQMSMDPWAPSPQTWNLTVDISPDGTGTVWDNIGWLVFDGDEYTATYPQDTAVTLTAIPAPGYLFEEWYGTYASLGTQNGNQIAFNMFINGYMEARFTPE